MRSGVILLVSASLLAACSGAEDSAEGQAEGAAPASATPASSPTIRPGLWRTAITGPTGEAQTVEKCLTAEESRKMAEDPAAGLEGAPNCTDFKVTREGGAIVTRATCPAEGVTSTLESRATGDFQNRYSVAMTMRMSGPQPTEMRFNMDSTRVGDC